jgi:hypothetical protein
VGVGWDFRTTPPASGKFLRGANFPNSLEHVDVCDLLPLSVTLLLFTLIPFGGRGNALPLFVTIML